MNSQILISNAIVITTLIIAVVYTTSALFPALFITITSPYSINPPINPLETGTNFFPFIILSSIYLIFTVLFVKKRLPWACEKFFKKFYNFELSNKLTIIVMVILFSFYIFFTVHELFEPEEWQDFFAIRIGIINWQFELERPFEILDLDTSLLYFSNQFFNNFKIYPFVVSNLLLVQTFFLTKVLTKKNFSAVLSTVIVLQSSIFLTYDTSPTYPNLYFVLYLFSLYTIFKKWYLSPMSFIVSVTTKAVSLPYIILTLIFIERSTISKRQKIKLLLAYGIVILISLVLFFTIFNQFQHIFGEKQFSFIDFWGGYAASATQLRNDSFVLISLLPLVIGLAILSRKQMKEADLLLIMITGSILFTGAVLAGWTLITVQPYRHISLIVFFAIGIGILISNKLGNRS